MRPWPLFDADGDGRLDLYLTSAVIGPKGIRDILLLNKGDGRFEDASASFGLSKDRASVGVAAADFDADRHIDLFLTGVGDNRLLRNRDGKSFEDISNILKPTGPPALSLTARWLDLDQDGDLDLYVVNYCAAEKADEAFGPGGPPPGLANVVYRNDGKPEPIPSSPEPTWAPLAVAVENVKSNVRTFDRHDALGRGRGVVQRRFPAHRYRSPRRRQRPRPGSGGCLGRCAAGGASSTIGWANSAPPR